MLEPPSALRWYSVKGASDYRVRVFQQDNPNSVVRLLQELPAKARRIEYPKTVPALNKEGFASMFMEYPRDAPALNKEGFAYLFSVTANTGASSLADAGACLGFRLLPANKSSAIRTKSSQIAQLADLIGDEKALAKAYYYDQEGLLGEAIETLEKAVTNGSSNPLIHHQLARYYAEAGLNLLAAMHAVQALEKYTAREKESMYSIARIYAELAVIQLMLGNPEAKQVAERAKALYQGLGGATDVDQQMRGAKDRLESAAEAAKKRASGSACPQITAPSN